MKIFRPVSITGFCLVILASVVEGVPVEQELRITPQELAALRRFRVVVQPLLKDDYMRSDLYLIRWLRAANLDIKGAEKRLLENLKFRAENKIDNILNEDWSDLEDEYPYTTDGHDKEGRPIVAFSLGEWDLRKGIVQGSQKRVIRYLDKAFEDVTVQIREKQARGENVTQAVFLINLANFNLQQHGCLQCLPAIYQYFLHQVYYPNLADKIILVNTPTLFEAVLTLLGPIMAPETRVALKVFGPDKSRWRNYLYSIIDKDQLYPEFGGTRKYRM